MFRDQLLYAEDGAPVPSALSRRRKFLIGLVGFLAVAAMIVGAIAGAQALMSSSSASPDSTSQSTGTSFMARPAFSQPIEPVKNAPKPTVYHVGDQTASASLNFSHSVVGTDGKVKHTHFSYDVEKNNNAHCLSTFETIIGLQCLNDTLRILFTNVSQADQYGQEWANGTIMMLRPEWGCDQHVRMFVEAPRIVGDVMYVRTINVTIAHAFRRATIRFYSNHTDDDSKSSMMKPKTRSPPTAPPASSSESRTHHRRSFWSFIKDAVEDVGSAIADVVKYAVTGDVTIDDLYSQFYTIPSTTLNVPGTVKANDASAQGSLTYSGFVYFTTSFELHITDYVTGIFIANVSVGTDMNIEPNLQSSTQFSYSPVAEQITEATYSVCVVPVFGIPIPIHLIVSVFAGYSLSFATSTTMAGNISAAGSAFYALTVPGSPLTSSGSQFNMYSSLNSPSFSGVVEFLPYLGVQGYLQVAYIGGPVGLVTLYGNVTADVINSVDDDTVDDNSDCVIFSEAIGLEVDVKATYSVQIGSLDLGSGQTAWANLYGPTPFWTSTPSTVCPNGS